jgi:hypothetical protein
MVNGTKNVPSDIYLASEIRGSYRDKPVDYVTILISIAIFTFTFLDCTYRYLETGVDPISMQACMAVI